MCHKTQYPARIVHKLEQSACTYTQNAQKQFTLARQHEAEAGKSRKAETPDERSLFKAPAQHSNTAYICNEKDTKFQANYWELTLIYAPPFGI